VTTSGCSGASPQQALDALLAPAPAREQAALLGGCLHRGPGLAALGKERQLDPAADPDPPGHRFHRLLIPFQMNLPMLGNPIKSGRRPPTGVRNAIETGFHGCF